MAGRKTVKLGHVVENDAAPANENKTALNEFQEPEGVYQPDMAPLAPEEKPETPPEALQTSPDEPKAPGPDTNTPEDPDAAEDDSGLLYFVVLKKGASFWYKGRVFKNGEPNAVEQEDAERLVESGYFERG